MAIVKTSKDSIPLACDGKNLWNGNKNPGPLVATVAQMKSAVQPWSCFAARNPNITTKPASIPTKLNKTCTNVKIVIPKIMGASLLQTFFGTTEGPLRYTRLSRHAIGVVLCRGCVVVF